MAFQDDVRLEIDAGRVPKRFKTAHLKKVPAGRPGYYRLGHGEYSANTIHTVPRNFSTSPDGTDKGYSVRKGRNPVFWWYGNGDFELIPTGEKYDVEEEMVTDPDPLAMNDPPLAHIVDKSLVKEIAGSEGPKPAKIIACYLAKNPFQAYYRRSPVGPVRHGWESRLEAYFWPKPCRDWKVTSKVVEDFSKRIQGALQSIEGCMDEQVAAGNLLVMFQEICDWGGVPLPEPNPSVLAAEVLTAWRALVQDQAPPSSCRLNSAWTKLYAFALPDECVIYDSRVAAALTSILDPVMGLISHRDDWRPYEGLGKVAGRGGSRPRKTEWRWPNGYQSWRSQIAANRLCRDVLKEVNGRPDSRTWTLREVEAVLFMEGY